MRRILSSFLFLLVLAGCGSQAAAGVSQEEFLRYFPEDYRMPVKGITAIREAEQGYLLLDADAEATVSAMQDGTVVYAAPVGWNNGWGKLVLVAQEDDYLLYAHCAKVTVQTGDVIRAGSPIATVGSTGDTDNTPALGVLLLPADRVVLEQQADGSVTGFSILTE